MYPNKLTHPIANAFRYPFRHLALATAIFTAITFSGGFDHGALAADHKKSGDVSQTLHKTVNVNGLDIFYREAGPKDAPTILLLHGFPTSSQMFRNLIPSLADRYHLVAPDYPGFQHILHDRVMHQKFVWCY